jgi:hypothetical protein
MTALQKSLVALSAIALTLSTTTAHASLAATATVSTTSTTSPYSYTITLDNTGTTNIGTLWFGWIPGYDFLPAAPTNISVPSGWTGFSDGPDFTGDGFSLEMYNLSGSAIAPGAIGTFGFKSTASPTALEGAAQFLTQYPATTSFVYIGFPENDPGAQFAATVAVPEPASLGILTVGLLTTLRRRPRRPIA